MDLIFSANNAVVLVLSLAILALKIFVFVMALTYSARAYEAADKLTKPGWLVILGIGLAWQLFSRSIGDLVSLGFTAAALVFLLDVMPALSSLRRR